MKATSRLRSTIFAVVTVMLLLPIPAFAVQWVGTSFWTTTATPLTITAATSPMPPFTMTGGGSVSNVSSTSNNAPVDGFLQVSMGSYNSQGPSTLTASLSRQFTAATTPAPLRVDYLAGTFFVNNHVSGTLNVRVTGPGGYNQLRTASETDTNPNLNSFFTFSGLSGGANYTVNITIVFSNSSNGTKSWNNTTSAGYSPHRFTFSGG